MLLTPMACYLNKYVFSALSNIGDTSLTGVSDQADKTTSQLKLSVNIDLLLATVRDQLSSGLRS